MEIGELEEIVNRISLDAPTKIYDVLDGDQGTIENYRLILEIIVKDILKK